jgi:multiple sugar transport system substrate-binding protein
LTSPPIVEALDELVAAAKLGPSDPFRYDPAAVRAAFWRGECGMAITWPSAAEERREKGEGGRGKGETSTGRPPFPVGTAELPGSPRVYNRETKKWEIRGGDEDQSVPLLAIAGRLGVVNAKSPHAEAAFQLLAWLSDSQMSLQISPASPATTLFRHSNLKSPGAWVEKPMPAVVAARYGQQTEITFRRPQWLGALRLPGRAEYLAALDEAVAAAVKGRKSSTAALQEAAAKWRKITERLGTDRQRAAYRHSLGLE